MGKFHAQKNAFSNDSNLQDYSIMYGIKTLTTNLNQETSNKDLNYKESKSKNKMHFSGSNSSIINSGKLI